MSTHSNPNKRRRRRIIAALIGGSILIAAVVAFPGQRLGMALRIGSGVALEPLQARIDELEAKAIEGGEFGEDDRDFLTDFYATLATGAKLTVVLGQSGEMMDHYLSGSGQDFALEPDIFVDNKKVKAQMEVIRQRAAPIPCGSGGVIASPTFYMPDRSNADSVFGLYHGTLELRRTLRADGTCSMRWRAEVPWTWPSYESLTKKYGDPHAESFPLPNVKSFIWGKKHALYVDNGLGEYLVQLGLAKTFVAYAEWDE